MRRAAWFLALVAVAAFAAPPLFQSPTESVWDVVSGGKAAGKITLLTDGKSSRAEWSAGSGAPVVFLAADGKVWVREDGGDVELASWRGGIEKELVPALLLPSTTSAKDRTELKSGKVATYAYGKANASYVWDGTGPKSVAVTSGSSSWTLTRTSSGKPSSKDASLYEVRPKKTASSRLASMAGGLFGPSDRSVSPTAGGRGVDKGAKFKDGGDYEALAELETLDDAMDEELADELASFQTEGKIGRGRGGDR